MQGVRETNRPLNNILKLRLITPHAGGTTNVFIFRGRWQNTTAHIYFLARHTNSLSRQFTEDQRMISFMVQELRNAICTGFCICHCQCFFGNPILWCSFHSLNFFHKLQRLHDFQVLCKKVNPRSLFPRTLTIFEWTRANLNLPIVSLSTSLNLKILWCCSAFKDFVCL